MATLGQTLKQPEEGWKRYDDKDSNIEYIGEWKDAPIADKWLGTGTTSHKQNDILRFNFTGDKLRIIGVNAPNNSNNMEIKIDDVIITNISCRKSSTVWQCLVYEIIGLEQKEHFVEIINLDATASNNYFGMDAIDIDENGILKKYNTDLPKFLIQQSKNIYSIDHNYLNLGESKSPIELSSWIGNYGYNDLNIINESLDNKHAPTIADEEMIYESLNIDFNDVKKPNIYVFEEDDKKKVRYDTDSYKIIDEIKKINGGIGNVVFKEY